MRQIALPVAGSMVNLLRGLRRGSSGSAGRARPGSHALHQAPGLDCPSRSARRQAPPPLNSAAIT